MKTAKNQTKRTPWGMVAGLLSFAFVVLIGVACGLDPAVVLQRGLVGSMLVSIVVSIAIQVVPMVSAPRKYRSWQR